jgi:alpha-tubulin suppressor-like RCC1 family protein
MTRVFWVALLMGVLTACFTRPDLRSRDGGPADDSGVTDAGVDGDAPDCTSAVDPPVPQFERLQFDHVSAGYFHACAIDTAGHMWCWGSNDHMQLGDRADSPGLMTGIPGRVSQTITGWTAVSASADHSCGIANNKAYCWGRNDAHQSLPNGTGGNVFPTEVSFAGVTLMPTEVPAKIFAGPTMSCTITNLNRAICWGDLDLTVGTSGPAAQLLDAPQSPTWRTMAIAEDHACAISMSGNIYCWGENDSFQLGVATPASRAFIAVDARDLTTQWTDIAVTRDLTCAVEQSTNNLVCFGSASAGHMGNVSGTYTNRPVITGGNVTNVAVNLNHLCIKTSSNEVSCIGDNTDGALGYGAFQGSRTPQGVVTQNVVELVTGEGFTCALDAADYLTCWGQNAHGELGVGTVATKRSPSLALLPIGSCESVFQVVSGDRHTCAIVGVESEGSGRAYCWGNNSQRQITSNTNELSIPKPVEVFAGEKFSRLAAGEMHTCALRADGAVRCWGDNTSGQLGVQSTSSALIQPIDNMPWTYIAAGSRASCALRAGEAYCWGNVPTIGTRATPTNFMRPMEGGAKFWSTIALGSGFGIGTAIDPALPNRVFVYGFAPTGCQLSQVPTNAGEPITSPQPLYTLDHVQANVTAAQANGGHVCIHMNLVNGTNKITCFGENGSNQCSPNEISGTTCVLYEDVATPPGGWRTAFPNTSTVTSSRTHTCALDTIGRPRCWGANNASELGNLPSANENPTQVTDQRFAEISTGADHTCGVGETRTNVSCWGENRYGQLGDDARFHAVPTAAGLVPP